MKVSKEVRWVGYTASRVSATIDCNVKLFYLCAVIRDTQHEAVRRALVDAGASDSSVKAVIKGALKTLGSKIIGEAADQVAEGIVDNSANFLEPLVNEGIGQICDRWHNIFAAEQR